METISSTPQQEAGMTTAQVRELAIKVGASGMSDKAKAEILSALARMEAAA